MSVVMSAAERPKEMNSGWTLFTRLNSDGNISLVMFSPGSAETNIG